MALDAQTIEILDLDIWAVLGVLIHHGAKLAVLDSFADLCRCCTHSPDWVRWFCVVVVAAKS